MSFQVYDNAKGSPPQPTQAKEGVVSFAYVTTTNDELSYIQLLGTNTIWVTGLAAAGTDTLSMPSDAQMIALFDTDQVLVGCNKHYSLYVDARCTLDATSPDSIILPVAGMYDLELTVISASAVYVSCQQISGGPAATSGNLIAPLVLSPATAGTVVASELIPPAGSGELIIVTAVDTLMPTAALLYTALYGTQTYRRGMGITFKMLNNRGAVSTITFGAGMTASTTFPGLSQLAANTMYLCTIIYTANASTCLMSALAIATQV